MSGLPEDMNCSLVGTDKKAGTVPMAVHPFSNKIYIYILSSSLFCICCAIIFYVFFKSKSTVYSNGGTPISMYKLFLPIITTVIGIIGVISIIFFNLYNNTPSTFNYLFFGMMGIIVTFCFILYLLITDKDYLMNILRSATGLITGRGLWKR